MGHLLSELDTITMLNMMPILVGIVSQNWDQLHSWVFEASEAILGGQESEKSLIYAK